jgi:EAL and modified HD-GYP domain-containing signal transduction protein
LGRQALFTADGVLCAHELLFRAAGLKDARADYWNDVDQDHATDHVISAAFHQGVDVTLGLPVSINFTGTYLLSHAHLHCDPKNTIIEVVESTTTDDALLRRLRELKAQGFRIAVDDFIGTPPQVALLEVADFVKLDYRDVLSCGTWLVDMARRESVAPVAERIETRMEFDEAVALGFKYFQGHYFEATVVLSVNAMDGYGL